jgi:LysM repeat protein
MAAFPRPVLAATCDTRYTVKAGDTKTSISRRFDVDWEDIADASDIDASDRIREGQRLCIPEKATTACDTRYTVKAGDTKTSISRRFDVDWEDIADASNIDASDRIREGQRLCIPEKGDEDQPNPDVRLRVSATHTRLTLTVSGLDDEKAIFIVRARDANVGIGGFFKLGRMRVEEHETTKQTFAIPTELMKILNLRVCIKNASTDEMRCQTVLHP